MGSYYCKMYIGDKCQRVFGGTKGFVDCELNDYSKTLSSITDFIHKEDISIGEPVDVTARFYCYRKNSRSKSKKLKKTVVINYRFFRDSESTIYSAITDKYAYEYDNRTISSADLVNTTRPEIKSSIEQSNTVILQKHHVFSSITSELIDETAFNSDEPLSIMKAPEEGKTDILPLKIFLSHPMSRLQEDEVMEIRNKAISELKERFGEIEIIDNYNHENVPPNAGRLWHLGASIQKMQYADGIYFCGNWKSAPGCIIERIICHKYGLLIL